MPALKVLVNDKNYLRRMTCLFTIKSILEKKDIKIEDESNKISNQNKHNDQNKNNNETNVRGKIDQAKLDNHNRNIQTNSDLYKKLIEHLLPFIIQLQTDKIPNVRFNVAICLEVLREKNTEVKTALEKLSVDADSDVKYYSIRALKSLGFIQ